jgi:hypothetical protein
MSAALPSTRCLFLGDYTGCGRNSCAVVLLLSALKFLYADFMHLPRGNYESFAMANADGFRRECEVRLSLALYQRTVQGFAHR